MTQCLFFTFNININKKERERESERKKNKLQRADSWNSVPFWVCDFSMLFSSKTHPVVVISKRTTSDFYPDYSPILFRFWTSQSRWCL